MVASQTPVSDTINMWAITYNNQLYYYSTTNHILRILENFDFLVLSKILTAPWYFLLHNITGNYRLKTWSFCFCFQYFLFLLFTLFFFVNNVAPKRVNQFFMKEVTFGLEFYVDLLFGGFDAVQF